MAALVYRSFAPCTCKDAGMSKVTLFPVDVTVTRYIEKANWRYRYSFL